MAVGKYTIHLFVEHLGAEKFSPKLILLVPSVPSSLLLLYFEQVVLQQSKYY